MSPTNWRITGSLLTIVGFLIPFVVAKGIAMPMGRHPIITALWAILWLAAFYCLYRAHASLKSYPPSFALWGRIAIYMKDHTPYFFLLSSLTGANFYPTALA